MKNLLTKRLFILLLLMTGIPSAIQANQSPIKSPSDLLKEIIMGVVEKAKGAAKKSKRRVGGVVIGTIGGAAIGIAEEMYLNTNDSNGSNN